MICHATQKRRISSSDDSIRKVVYLAVMNASKKWTMPIQNSMLANYRAAMKAQIMEYVGTRL